MSDLKLCIVHYNTPRLTECLVRSINKFTPNCTIYIFDNSDKFPFTYRQENIVYFDNTKGQIINFNTWLNGFSKKLKTGSPVANKFASAKHCISIEKCMDLIEGDFILLDSDILLKKDISELADSQYVWVGDTELRTLGNKTATRVIPYILYINNKECKKKGFHFFDENYMHGLSAAGNIYDTGGYFFLKTKHDKFKKICYKDYIVHFKAGSWEESAKKFNNYQQVSQNEWLFKNRKFYEMNKNVIYTCITGAYELLDDPFVLSPGYDYVCFTNYDQVKSDIWQVRPIPKELDGLTEVKKQRCIKINAHKYLPEYDFSIWVDGSVKLKKDVNEFIAANCKGADVFIPMHPRRNCIYKEMEACIKIKKDTAENIQPQKDRYTAEHFPKDFGLVQTNVMMRYHNRPGCIKLMEAWWNEVKNGSHRDQLSFDYARWKNPDVKFKFINKSTCETDFFKWDKTHGKGKLKKMASYVHHVVEPQKEYKRSFEEVRENVQEQKERTRMRPITVTVPPTLRRKVLSQKLKNFLGD